MKNRKIKIEVPVTTYHTVETTVVEWLVQNIVEVRAWSEHEVDIFRNADRCYTSRGLLERVGTFAVQDLAAVDLAEFDTDPRAFWERVVHALPDQLLYEMGVVE